MPVDEKPTRVTLHHVRDCPDCTCAGAQFNEISNFEACHYKALCMPPRLRELPRLVQEHAPWFDRPPPGDDIL